MNWWLLLLAITSLAGVAYRWSVVRNRARSGAPAMVKTSRTTLVLAIVSAITWCALFILSFRYHL